MEFKVEILDYFYSVVERGIVIRFFLQDHVTFSSRPQIIIEFWAPMLWGIGAVGTLLRAAAAIVMQCMSQCQNYSWINHPEIIHKSFNYIRPVPHSRSEH